MTISRASQTALSGLQAAQVRLAAVAHNLANQQTDGFHQLQVQLADGDAQLLASGSSPGPNTGGSNPRHVGTGVVVVGITEDTTPGPQIATPQGVRELSNTDTAGNLIEATLAGHHFRANLEVLRVEESLFEELLSLRRQR